MWRRRLDARSRLLLLVALFACFGFVLAVVLNLVRFEPIAYELASPMSKQGHPSHKPPDADHEAVRLLGEGKGAAFAPGICFASSSAGRSAQTAGLTVAGLHPAGP